MSRKYPLTRADILDYALEGVRTKIGTHPTPNDYQEEIDEYESHFEQLLVRYEKEIAKLQEKENKRSGTRRELSK